jgi:eukaryotic-like serine/threonine-protein kinase
VLVGQHLGPYQVLAKLGEGGMGEVYRARDTRLQREVAIKILPEIFASDPERLARFEREAQVLAALNHPHIAQIYGIEESGAVRALVMELVEGETLADRIARGPMPVDEALPIARQIAEGLEAAHERGVIHRDLKPANIKMTPGGIVKILDFGLAKLTEPNVPDGRQALSMSPTITSPVVNTGVGVLLGTAAYMAPEQARGRPVDKRADIWAFGVVLYELVTGRRPFDGADVTDAIAAVLKEAPDLASAPRHLQPLLARCLEKDPARRLRDLGDLDLLLRPAAPEARHDVRWRWAWPTLTAIAAVTAIALSVMSSREAAPQAPIRLEALPPEGTRLTGALAFAPDGRMLAFGALGDDGRAMIWLRELDSGRTRPIRGTEGVGMPIIWSPDSRALAFSGPPPLATLMRIDVSGGPAQALCPAPAGAPVGAWSPDGTVVFRAENGLRRVAASGGECETLTTLDRDRGEIRHTAPAFLPDGRRFLYLRVSSRPEVQGIYLGSLDRSPDEQDTSRLFAAQGAVQFLAPDILLFERDEALVAQRFDLSRLTPAGEPVTVATTTGQARAARLLAERESTSLTTSATGALAYLVGDPALPQLRWFDRSSRPLETVGGVVLVTAIAMARGDGRIAIQRADVDANEDLWIHDDGRGTTNRVTFSPAIDGMPVWSHDDRALFFASNRTGTSQIYRRAADLNDAEELVVQSTTEDRPLDVSPDGRFLLMSRAAAPFAEDLWVLRLTDPPAEPTPLLATSARETQARFSPDGRYVVYVSNDSGTAEVYVRPFADGTVGAPQQISEGGGSQPLWRTPDELLFLRGDSTAVAVPVRTQPSFQRGAPQTLFTARMYGVGNNQTFWRWDVSPDGRRFLIVTTEDRELVQHVGIIVNWPALLER